MLGLLAGPSVAQQPDPLPPTDGAETYFFRSLLKFQGLEPVTELPRDASRVVLVLFGRVERITGSGTYASELARTVLNAGGAVLIASDATKSYRGYFPLPTDVTVRPYTTRRPTAESYLDGRADLPFLVPPAPTVANTSLVQMSQFRRVAANGPGELAVLPAGAYSGVRLADLPGGVPFAVGNDPTTAQRGETAAVYADAGVFSNQMLAAAGTDNLAYSYHLAKYLVTGGKQRRKQCLFVEDGAVKTDFDRVPLSAVRPPPPTPPVPDADQVAKKLVESADRAADSFQKSDALDRYTTRKHRDIFVGVVIAVVVLVCGAVLRRFWASRHTPDLTPVPVAADPPGSLLDRRRAELLRANDLYVPVREYLRERFAAWGGPAAGGDLPAVETSGLPANGRPLRATLSKLWAIAYGDVPERVTVSRWKELEPMIETVDRAADAGRWRFPAGGAA